MIIARANKPVTLLIPIEREPVQRRLGEAGGLVAIAPNFDTLPDDFMEHFR